MKGNIIQNIIEAIKIKIRAAFNNPYAPMGVSSITIKKLKHLPYFTPGIFKMFGSDIHYGNPPEVVYFLKEFFVNGIYRIDFSKPNPYIIDCGSNIGFSIIHFKIQYPNSEILAFEPDDKNFDLLQKNIKPYRNIQLENKAVWNMDTTLNFIMDGTQGSGIAFDKETTGTKKVTAVRLKKYLERKVDFLKIDIEGAEYEVIMDCKEELKNVDKLFVEYHGVFTEQYKLFDILDVLKSLDYKIYIKEADNVYPSPFVLSSKDANKPFDHQYNIFAFK